MYLLQYIGLGWDKSGCQKLLNHFWFNLLTGIKGNLCVWHGGVYSTSKRLFTKSWWLNSWPQFHSKVKLVCLRKKNLTFCLGGERRELSLAKFTMRTKNYLSSKFHTDWYLEFIASYMQTTDGFKDDTYCPTIANGTYS